MTHVGDDFAFDWWASEDLGSPFGFLDYFLKYGTVSSDGEAGFFCFDYDFAEAGVEVYVCYLCLWVDEFACDFFCFGFG